MLGYRNDSLVGRITHAGIHRHAAASRTGPRLDGCPIDAVLAGGVPRRVTDEVFWRGNHSSFPVDYTAAPLREEGRTVGAVIVFDDVTAQRTLEDRLRYNAEHDPLTGLYNRRRFIAELESQLVRQTGDGPPAAVALLDLDAFKFVNDSLGHDAGDRALQRVATLIEARLRSSDVVSRLGGDEFAIFLRDVEPDDASNVLNGLLASIKTKTTPALSASAGIACFDGSTSLQADELIIGADIALYEAKQHGGQQCVRWNGSGGTKLAWVEEIREALREERFVLYTPPIIELATGTVVREEALIRMLNRDGDIIPPVSFLPTAERFGLIRDIDRLVLTKALDLVREGRRLAVNISGRSLADRRLVELLSAAAGDGLDVQNLSFEITETAAVRNLAEAQQFVEILERFGCELGLDDFGTGFCSLSYLKSIPVQVLKIDREFVASLSSSSIDQHMVRMLVGIAKRLGQRTVAEGVEDAATLVMLRSLGVDEAQGHFISRPAPAEAEACVPSVVGEAIRGAAAGC
jgi:diguanylate cyclase (GGDEF)-like protein